MLGAQSVMICGALLMPQWSADSWDSLLQVWMVDFQICTQIGFYLLLGAQAVLFAGFGQGTGSIWLDNVNCAGTEARLAACPANPIGSHNCVHSEDAGVRCQAVTTPPPGKPVK